jgi:hypothetical protein
MFNGLSFVELVQVTKALIAFGGEKLPDPEAHYLSGLTVEVLMVSSEESRTVLRIEPK